MLNPSEIENSVDLLSGQVQFPVNLVQLPGRNGLDLNISISYNSQILEQATYWNLSEPTGVLGLGWSLPNQGIFRIANHTSTLAASSFYLSGKIGNTLLQCIGETGQGTFTFAAENYAFWKVSYNPQSEIWTIVVENGDTYTYGDTASGRNTVQWSVNWGNWIDSSNQNSGQSQIASVWNLSEVSNRYNDRLTYTYLQTQKHVASASGLLFTQASYISSIENALGQMVSFQYEEKTLDEYQDPHSNPSSPNAYQDRFETKYLQSIEVLAPNGSTLYSQVFGYSSTFLGTGNLTKRLLSSITRKSAKDRSLPATLYSYYTSSDNVSASTPYNSGKSALYGALKTITFQEGGTATYKYTAITNGYSALKTPVSVPVTAGVTYSNPKFYFKESYTLVTWLGSDNTFSLQSYYWSGRWLHKDLGSFAIASAAYDDFNIELKGNYFSFFTSSKLYLFRKNEAQNGEWIQPSVGEAGSEVAYFSPAFDSGSNTPLVCANDFAAILGTNSGKLMLYQYYWDGLSWKAQDAVELASLSNPKFNLVAIQNQVFAIYWQSGSAPKVYQSGIDLEGSWKNNTLTLSGLTLDAVTSINLFPGQTFGVFTFISPIAGAYKAQYGAFWSNEDQSQILTQNWDTQYFDTEADIPNPKIHNSLVAINQYTYRYNGVNWLEFDTNSISYSGQTSVNIEQVGIDQVVRKITTTEAETYVYDLLAYNPNTNSWGDAAQIKESDANIDLLLAGARCTNTGSVFALIANKLYTKASDGVWASSFTVPDTLVSADLPTVQLLENNLLAYQVNTGSAGQKTVVYPLKNGTVENASSPLNLTGEQIYSNTLPDNALVSDSSFITFTGDFGDAASDLSLYRPLNGAVQGQQTTYAVNVIMANNGYIEGVDINATFIHGISYEASTAIPNGNGYSSLFNKVTRIPGSDSPSTTPNGTIDFYFFNGIASNFGETPSLAYPVSATKTNAADFYSIVKGTQYTVNINSFTTELSTLSSSVQYWWVYSLQLGTKSKGYYIRQLQEVSNNEGVEQTSQQTFDSNTGLVTQTLFTNYNTNGDQENWTEDFIYFWQKYDTTRALNILTPIVQTTSTTKNVTQDTTTTRAIYITTWKENWGTGSSQWSPYKAFEAESASPPTFDSWQSTQADPTTGWLKVQQVDARNPFGKITQKSDVESIATSVIYDDLEILEVSNCYNAKLNSGEFSYLDFEPYANSNGWSYSPSTISLKSQITEEDFNTGTQCLSLAPNASDKNGPIQYFTPSAQQNSYVFGSWGKVDQGFDSANGKAQWEILIYKVSDNTKVGSPILVDMSASIGKWSYFQSIIDLVAIRTAANLSSSEQLTIGIQAYNQNSAANAWVDNLRFSPLLGTFNASIFDPIRWRPTSDINNTGQVNQLVYNSLDLIVANIGPLERVNSVSLQSYSRSLTAGNNFLPDYPNSVLKLATSDTSQFYDFHNVDQSDWAFSPATNWEISSGSLNFSVTTAAAGLGGTAVLSEFVRTNFAARVEVERPNSATPKASVSLGNGGVFLHWKETGTDGTSTGEWQLLTVDTDGNSTVVQTNSSLSFREDWLFMIVDNYVCCFVDGIQIFNYQYTIPSPLPSNYGKLIIASTLSCSFDNLILLQEPQMTVDFIDGLGNTLQSISLEGLDPSGSLYPNKQAISSSGILLDSLGRSQYTRNPVTAPLQLTSYNAGEDNTDAQWIESNQDTYLYDTSGTLETLPDYLAGTSGDIDFSTQSYEPSPLSRIAQIEKPRTQGSTTSNFTTSFTYAGATSIPSISGTFTGETKMYFQNKMTQVQSIASDDTLTMLEKWVIKDIIGNVIAELEGTPSDLQKTEYIYDSSGNLIETKMPNYFAPPANSDAASWIEQNTYTFKGLLSKKVTPDTGTTQFAYNSANRMRFKMDANGAAKSTQQIIYYKYDALGRIIEEGYIQSANYTWGSPELDAKLNTAEFPITDSTKSSDPNYAAGAWQKKYTYDSNDSGDGKYLIGQLYKTLINNNATPDSEVQSYDAYGNVLTVTTAIQAQGGDAFTTNYLYNNQNQVSQISYPKIVEADTTLEVAYTYDRLGRLVAVGKPTDGTEVVDPSNPPTSPQIFYAFYEYDFQGRFSKSTLNSQALETNTITRNYSYTDEGYLNKIEDDYFTELLGYTDGSGLNGISYYNGLIASSAFSYKAGAHWSAPPLPYTYQLGYDGNNQLSEAKNSINDAWTVKMGSNPGSSFDANGNMQNVERGVNKSAYSYLFDTEEKISNNKLATLSNSTNETQDFEGVSSSATQANGWEWGSNNGGPSGTAISTDSPHSGTQCLLVGGGSLGHFNYLRLPTYLDPTATYSFNSWIKTKSGFDVATGDAGWYLKINQASGQLVEKKIVTIAKSDSWTELQETLNLPNILNSLGLSKTSISFIQLELRNYKRPSTTDSGPGIYVDDITLTGSTTEAPYAYDANGNATSSPSPDLYQIDYDAVTNLTRSIQLNSTTGNIVSYQYAAQNKRVWQAFTKSDNTPISNKFSLFGNQASPLIEKKSTETTSSYYISGVGGILATIQGDELHYPLKDHLGSTRILVDGSNGNVINSYDYLPYGELMRTSGENDFNKLYTGQTKNEHTDLYDFELRLLDAGLRRFSAPDPYDEYASPYIYAANNPINFTDPTGGISRYSLLALSTAVLGLSGGLGWFFGYTETGKKIGDKYVKEFAGNVKPEEHEVMNAHHPILGAHILAPFYALTYVNIRHQTDNEKQNALRHCLSHNMLNKYLSHEVVKNLGEAHELGAPSNLDDNIADKINNNVATLLSSSISEDELIGYVVAGIPAFYLGYTNAAPVIGAITGNYVIGLGRIVVTAGLKLFYYVDSEFIGTEAERLCYNAWNNSQLARGSNHENPLTPSQKAKICESYVSTLSFLNENNVLPTTFTNEEMEFVLSCNLSETVKTNLIDLHPGYKKD